MPSVDLVIFDCDGVLVDSEARILASLGWPLSEPEIVEHFVGRSARYMQDSIERQLGRSIDWEEEFERHYKDAFEHELVAVDGVLDTLDRLTVPCCVASSGSQVKMQFTLGLTGLLERFSGRIFSADEVAHGKPAPDVFLYAADQMGVLPERCAVVEDSRAGVTAGLAAGMVVFGFAGGVTPASKLSMDGVVVFDDMRTLPAHLSGFTLAR